MKKYLTKRILLTILSVIGVFALFAFLFGQYVLIEDDFFLDGEVAFVVRSLDGNSRVYATEEQSDLVREWLTTLEKINDTYRDDVFVFNSPVIRIKTNDSTIFLDDFNDDIIVYITTDGITEGALQKSVTARSNDKELTQRIFEICRKAMKGAQSTSDPVWLE